MTKTYHSVTNSQRLQLIELIHRDKMSIRQAAAQVGIFYPTAKAINKIFKKENRVERKKHRFRKVAIFNRARHSKRHKQQQMDSENHSAERNNL